jgi:hypothetical protein
MPNVDVFTRVWNVTWRDAARDIAVFDIDDVPVPTMSLAHLIESKRTVRTREAADIEVLEAVREMLGQ